MKLLPDPIEFDWDKGNIKKNYEKHQVMAKEAEEVFVNKPNLVADDLGHSTIEKRYQIFGVTNENRNLTIIFTIRDDKIRVISARDMNRKERRFYEEKVKANSKI